MTTQLTLWATRQEKTAYIRIHGRASFDCCSALRCAGEDFVSAGLQLVVDCTECAAVDSSVMGTLTMLANKQLETAGQLVLVNVNDNVKGCLKEIGITMLFKFEDDRPLPEGKWVEIYPAQTSNDRSQLEKGRTSLKAHQALIEVDSENEARFGAVVDALNEDVERLQEQENANND